jgi:hypothetical protein
MGGGCMKWDYKKIKHVAFCMICGFPKKLHLFYLRKYYATGNEKTFYCGNCGCENEFPKYILDYIKEL